MDFETAIAAWQSLASALSVYDFTAKRVQSAERGMNDAIEKSELQHIHDVVDVMRTVVNEVAASTEGLASIPPSLQQIQTTLDLVLDARRSSIDPRMQSVLDTAFARSVLPAVTVGGQVRRALRLLGEMEFEDLQLLRELGATDGKEMFRREFPQMSGDPRWYSIDVLVDARLAVFRGSVIRVPSSPATVARRVRSASDWEAVTGQQVRLVATFVGRRVLDVAGPEPGGA